MSDQKSSSKLIVWITILLALVGIIAPIVWDLVKNDASLELRCKSKSTLIERADAFDKLRVHYDNLEVKELSIYRFILSNTGSRSLRGGDLVAPPTITFPPEAVILDCRIDSLDPSNLDVKASKVDGSNAVSVVFPLLNPTDSVGFYILVGRSSQSSFSASARIDGIKKLDVFDDSERAEKKARRSTPFYLILIGSSFVLLMTIVILVNVPAEVRFKRLVKSGQFKVDCKTKAEAVMLVERYLSWCTDSETREIDGYIEKFSGVEFGDEERRDLLELFLLCETRAVSNVGVSIFFGACSIVGFIYIALVYFL